MTERYIQSRPKYRHPARDSREKLLKLMDRYDWKIKLVARAMHLSPTTVMEDLKRLAPDVVEQKKAEGKLSYHWSAGL